MAIFDKTGHADSITEGWRALKLFTDRYELIRLFLAMLNEDPAPEKILFFHGEGGNGKSLLMRFLREKCCIRVSQRRWNFQKQRTDEELRRFVEDNENTPNVATSYIDFGQKPTERERPQEGFSALLMMRRQLGKQGLLFPLFDFANIWYLHRTDQLTKERLRSLFPAEEAGFVASVFDALSGKPWAQIGSAVLSLFNEHMDGLREKFILYMQRRGVDEERVAEIQRMDPQADLVPKLAEYFAHDLNTAILGDDLERIVLFFDTHEAFWGEQRKLPTLIEFERDEWLRRLLRRIELKKGIQVVVAGRDTPQWTEANEYDIPETFVHLKRVGNLPDVDAHLYLERAGVRSEKIEDALIDNARVRANEVHPLYLGLGADVALAAQARGHILDPQQLRISHTQNKGKILIQRLLKWVDKDVERAVYALSACRSFDRNIFEALAGPLRYEASEANFRVITRFSFVSANPERQRYQMHNLLRRVLRELDEEVVHKADETLERYYRTFENDDTALAEAIFHLNRIDQSRSLKEWVDQFREALEASKYTRCEVLRDVRSELRVSSVAQKGLIASAEADFFALLSRYEAAQASYKEALTSFEQALTQASGDMVGMYNNKGITQVKLAEIQARLQPIESLASYKEALVSFEEVLKRDPDHVQAHNNKGNTLRSLGDLQAKLSQHPEPLVGYEESLANYKDALASFKEVLERNPKDVGAHSNKGSVLRSLGDLQARLQPEEALVSYEQSVASFDEALRLKPNFAYAYNNKGNALKSLGDLHARASQHPQTRLSYAAALASYEQSVASFDEALRWAPDDVKAHSNKGDSQMNLGNLQLRLSQHAAAQENYERSVASFDEALHWASNDVKMLRNKGFALAILGDLQALSRPTEALSSYGGALAAFKRSYEIAPDPQVAEFIRVVQGLIDGMNNR